jgi:hypothetical protein
MNVTIESEDGAHVEAVIESVSWLLDLSAVARTNGMFVSIGADWGPNILLHTTVEFADRLARMLRREVTAWNKRTASTDDYDGEDTRI